eukprot:snap_masked-scaffold_39-processed-gene-0.22-mRNA-1 protein AED:1.00 eAED:1.00 QI:0/-1/0/0/-1/1/1/0/140
MNNEKKTTTEETNAISKFSPSIFVGVKQQKDSSASSKQKGSSVSLSNSSSLWLKSDLNELSQLFNVTSTTSFPYLNISPTPKANPAPMGPIMAPTAIASDLSLGGNQWETRRSKDETIQQFPNVEIHFAAKKEEKFVNER